MWQGLEEKSWLLRGKKRTYWHLLFCQRARTVCPIVALSAPEGHCHPLSTSVSPWLRNCPALEQGIQLVCRNCVAANKTHISRCQQSELNTIDNCAQGQGSHAQKAVQCLALRPQVHEQFVILDVTFRGVEATKFEPGGIFDLHVRSAPVQVLRSTSSETIMNPFVFHCPTRVYFGEHTAATAAEVAKEYGATKTLIVTDEVLVKAGVLQPILGGFKESEYVLFTDVPPDSDVGCVNNAANFARQAKCNAILAVGGGSVLDTAKVVNVCLSLGGELLEYQGLNNLSQKLLPLIAVPTTAGTGSEVSMVAMVKDHAEEKKLLFGSRFLAPDVADTDPMPLVSLPPRLTAATGLDAITHNIESYSAMISNSVFTDALCLESMRLLFESLPRATTHGDDLEARAATLVAQRHGRLPSPTQASASSMPSPTRQEPNLALTMV